jgi:lipopolysaccharide transport system permease protein
MPQLSVSPSPTRVTLRPSRGWQPVNVGELLRFRDLLFELASRDVRLRYKQTAVGVVWVLMQPIAAAGIFSFVFGVMAGLRVDGMPYFVFSFSGVLAWNVFSSTLAKASASMVGNAALVSKVYFPRLILPLSTVASTLIDLVVSLAMLALLFVVYGVVPGAPIVLLPLWLGLLLMLSLGLGLAGAALTVSYRDVQYVLPVLLPFVLYASPVAYRVSDVPAAYRAQFYLVNPLASLVEGFRWSVLGTAAPPWIFVVYSAVIACLALSMGAAMFRRMERTFADVI